MSVEDIIAPDDQLYDFGYLSMVQQKDSGSESDSSYTKQSPEIPLARKPKRWSYKMRRSMQEVVPGLYLGPYSAVSRSKLQTLLDTGITHIICVRQNIEANVIRPNFPDQFKYLVLDIADTITENIIQHFQNVKKFIDEALQLNGRVLVHGSAGMSRSAALVIAYIMETYELTQERAFKFVLERRRCINPNEGFMMQLREYEPIYQANKMLKDGQENSQRQCNKRTIYEIETEDSIVC